jgi:hypothetical protein
LEAKTAKLEQTEGMLQEFQSWRGKLEIIEQRMKSEVEHWKSCAGQLQSENTSLQKEALKLSRDLMEKAKQVKSQ